MTKFADVEDKTMQAAHGLWALASGGWWGRGLGHSREKWQYLPEAHNDFIFAVIGEELGVIGCLVVILLFGVMTYAGTVLPGEHELHELQVPDGYGPAPNTPFTMGESGTTTTVRCPAASHEPGRACGMHLTR